MQDCERSQPQVIGFGPPYDSIMPIVIFILVIMGGLFLLYAMIYLLSLMCCNSRRNELRDDHRSTSRSKAATEFNNTDAYQLLLPKEAPSEEQGDGKEEEEEGVTAPLLTKAEATLAHKSTDDSSPPSFSPRRKGCPGWVKTGLLLTLSALFITGSVLYFPRTPDYNICNRNFDWKSIFDSLKSITPKVNYDVLLSISNQNRFGFTLVEAEANIHHNNITVGRWQMDPSQPLTIMPGSITDFIITLHLAPGFSEGAALAKDFYSNTLVFNIDAAISGVVTYHGHSLTRLATHVNGIEFNVGAETPRNLCNCRDYN